MLQRSQFQCLYWTTHALYVAVTIPLCWEKAVAVDHLCAIQALIVDHNQLGHLPAQIGCLERLETLSCSHNLLLSLPVTMAKLANLKFLNCSSNKIVSLPTELGRATAMEEINASDNYLQVCFPPIIWRSWYSVIRSALNLSQPRCKRRYLSGLTEKNTKAEIRG